MSDEEAKGVLGAEFIKLQATGYRGLVELLAEKQVISETVGLSGTAYHVELQGFWEDDQHSELRVVASIDDGGLRSFLPFTDAFTIDPTGKITDHSTA